MEAIKEDIAILDEYYGSELWKQDLADDEAGRFPKDLKRGVLSEDGIWNLLSDYRDLNSNKNTYKYTRTPTCRSEVQAGASFEILCSMAIKPLRA